MFGMGCIRPIGRGTDSTWHMILERDFNDGLRYASPILPRFLKKMKYIIFKKLYSKLIMKQWRYHPGLPDNSFNTQSMQ